MDITGARWGLPGAEAVLLLRAVISNGDFDAYWAWHLAQELQRTHLTRYQESGPQQPDQAHSRRAAPVSFTVRVPFCTVDRNSCISA